MTKALEIVQQFYAAVGAGDMQKAASLMAEDVRWMEAENFTLSDRNPYVGPQAVIEGVFARLGYEVDNFGLAPERFIANETSVVMEGRYTGTGKATGKPFNPQIAHVWTVDDDKITSYQQHVDTLAVARATGKVD